jgi:NCS1 family nucleobase:cation symporter-1
MVVSLISCLIACALTFYSGSVSLLSAAEAFRPIRSSRALRSMTIIIAGILVITVTLLLPSDTLGSFSAFLSILGYFLIPWTAVNLTDYYFVRRGMYSITDILKSDGGIYGRWGITGMVSYGLGFVAMVPFFSTAIYTGPGAAALGGADVAFAIGLTVSAGAYLLITRRHDFSDEFIAVRAAPLNTIDQTAEPHGSVTTAVEGTTQA